MSGEAKDPAIKLFGMTILSLSSLDEGVGADSGGDWNGEEKKDEVDGKDDDVEDDDDEETASDVKVSSGSKQEASSSDTTAGVSSKTDEEQSTSNLHKKSLKKPDKILPCPRCISMDTKFCYYNNYNLNQPRHFCKNCQRYWTAGGTMRNVPVGAGRRKNKSTSMASNSRHITVPESLRIPNGFHHLPCLETNGTIITFGNADSPLCESMASVLNIGEKSVRKCTQNGFHKAEELIIHASCRNAEKGVDISCGPEVEAVAKDCTLPSPLGFPAQIPCFSGAPLAYPLSPLASVPQMIPMPFYPAAAYWSIPWIPQLPQPWATSGPNSPTLGKHSRDENVGKPDNLGKEESSSTEGNADKCLWVPKTLRIDDPREAAKSSIWATLGIKKVRDNPANIGFKAFRPASEARRLVAESSAFLQANPAALSRSFNFHENA